MEKEKLGLGGFEAIMDSFIPKSMEGINDIELDNNEPLDDDELEDIKKNSIEPVLKGKGKSTKTEEIEEEELEDEDEDEEEEDDIEPVKPAKKQATKKKEEPVEDNDIEEGEDNIVTNFFDAIAEKLGWDFDEEENDSKPKDVDELINYFQKVIEEESKPTYSSEEMEALDNFVKQGGDLAKYLTIEAELDLDNIDIEDENNQKLIVKQFLKEKGFSDKRIEKQISKYEDAGLLEDEAQDAIEDLKEIKEQKKEQLLKEQKKQHEEALQRQQQFYTGVVDEIKGLKNIRGIAVPDRDKKVLMDYILKPDTDGKTKYQKDYAKGGVKSLIESAYFTMNADKLLEAAKKEGNNKAIDRFKKSLRSTGVGGKSKPITNNSEDTIWSNLTRQLRIS